MNIIRVGVDIAKSVFHRARRRPSRPNPMAGQVFSQQVA